MDGIGVLVELEVIWSSVALIVARVSRPVLMKVAGSIRTELEFRRTFGYQLWINRAAELKSFRPDSSWVFRCSYCRDSVAGNPSIASRLQVVIPSELR